MADLSHWDFAENFSGYDASALVLGLEPTESRNEQQRIQVVKARMERDYDQHLNLLLYEQVEIEKPDGDFDPKKYVGLVSVESTELSSLSLLRGADTPLNEWIFDSEKTRFEKQFFERYSIVRWIKSIGMKSVYRFDLSPCDVIQNIPSRWPWGYHNTKLLGHLEDAAREFWLKYDPQNQKLTAPKRDEVINWLKARNVSNQMATAIATILRPDDLPNGPRK